ncbi:MAG TPA: methyltransferase domain-containing protein [Bacteroidota bacterium]|nr:methyltransferase domain-containing protein [Bacteroidota bacterium]
MKKQTIVSQKGEIEFRKLLYQKQIEGKTVIDDEYDSVEIEKVLHERMQKTFDRLNSLRNNGITISPYVEIGAERCQRSLVMENKLDAAGASVDISYDMLKSCDHYKTVFNFDKTPIRICCDANNLPFKTDSVPFLFCYETLHHFPDPTPIINEIYRVLLPGAYFFFDEEPYKRILRIKLLKSRKVHSNDSQKLSTVNKLFDFFCSEIACNEVEYGIIENLDIPLSLWKKALRPFEIQQMHLESIKGITSELFKPKNPLKLLFTYLFGGTISGLCRKPGVHVQQDVSLYELLICPTCLLEKSERGLSQENQSLLCGKCGRQYSIIDNIIFLFTDAKLKELYPDIFEKYYNHSVT